MTYPLTATLMEYQIPSSRICLIAAQPRVARAKPGEFHPFYDRQTPPTNYQNFYQARPPFDGRREGMASGVNTSAATPPSLPAPRAHANRCWRVQA